MKTIPAILLGVGGVGQQLVHHILSTRSHHSSLLDLEIRVVGVADSQSLLLVDDPLAVGLSDAVLMDVCRAKSSGAPLASVQPNSEMSQLFKGIQVKEKVLNIANVLGKSTGLVLVDCSASADTVDMLKLAMDFGCCVVLANKKPLTCGIEIYEKLAMYYRRLRYESTVGAGLPVIASLSRIISSGDPVSRIVGSLSGTLGYVMSKLEDGKSFSQVVQLAKQLGFTEPDPRDDLGGMDVARKALILARLLGQRLSMDDIKVESLYPIKMGPDTMSLENFLNNGLGSLDESIEKRIKTASDKGRVLRYVCVIEGSRCVVGLQELPKDSPLGRLKGSDNLIEIYSRCYQNSPLVIQGAGAGNDTTAAGVLADIIDLQDLFR